MSSYTLTVNGNKHTVNTEPDTPLLWVLRDTLGYTGVKFGCGQALCGACMVYMNEELTYSCSTSIKDADGKIILTIEGLAEKAAPLIKSWLEDEVSQCGYCQPGQLMSAYYLLKKNSTPSDKEIEDAMSANICRCGTYQRIKKAIHRTVMEGGLK